MKTVPFNRDFEQMLISAERYACDRFKYCPEGRFEIVPEEGE